MLRRPDPPPMSTRVAADRPITAVLLAAVSGQSLELAESVHAAWLQTARLATVGDTIVVFDTFVLGRPDPFLREVAHQLRVTRRAEARGDFLDEEDRFYDEHDGDDGADDEPPTLGDRVVAALRHLSDSDRLVDDGRFSRMLWALHDFDRSSWLPQVRVKLAMERLVLELADAVHLDGAVVIDGRLPGERVNSLRWPA